MPNRWDAAATDIAFVTAAAEDDVVMLRSGTTLKQITVANLLKSCLRLAAAPSTTLQTVTIGGTNVALALATTKVQVGTSSAHFVGFFGGTPVAVQSVGTTGGGYDTAKASPALGNLGLGELTP